MDNYEENNTKHNTTQKTNKTSNMELTKTKSLQ